MQEVFTVEDVAKRYGLKVVTIYDYIRKQKLGAVRVGKNYVIRAQDIEEFERVHSTMQYRHRPEDESDEIWYDINCIRTFSFLQSSTYHSE